MNQGAVIRAWMLALAWSGVIVLESYVGSAANTGRFLRPILYFFFPHLSGYGFYLIHGAIRKTGHFLGYSVLSLTYYRASWATMAAREGTANLSWATMIRAWRWRAALVALFVTLAVASADEWHQSFQPGRTAKVTDVVLDEMGGTFAQLMLLVFAPAGTPARRKLATPVTSG